jgi:hypothetical protein
MLKYNIYIIIGILLFVIFNNLDTFVCQNPFRDVFVDARDELNKLNKGFYPFMLKDNNVFIDVANDNAIVVKDPPSTMQQNGCGRMVYTPSSTFEGQYPSPDTNQSVLKASCNPGSTERREAAWVKTDPNVIKNDTSFTCNAPSLKVVMFAHGIFVNETLRGMKIPYNMQFFTYINSDNGCFGFFQDYNKVYDLFSKILNPINPHGGVYNSYFNRHDDCESPDTIYHIGMNELSVNHLGGDQMSLSYDNTQDTIFNNMRGTMYPKFGKVYSESEVLIGNIRYSDDIHNIKTHQSLMNKITINIGDFDIYTEYDPSDPKSLFINWALLDRSLRTDFFEEYFSILFEQSSYGPYNTWLCGLSFTSNDQLPGFIDQNIFDNIPFNISSNRDSIVEQITFTIADTDMATRIAQEKKNTFALVKDMCVNVMAIDLLSTNFLQNYSNLVEILFPQINLNDLVATDDPIMYVTSEGIPIRDIYCELPLFCINAYCVAFSNSSDNADLRFHGGNFRGSHVRIVLIEILTQISNRISNRINDIDSENNYGYGYIFEQNINRIGMKLVDYAEIYELEFLLSIDSIENMVKNIPITISRPMLKSFNMLGIFDIWMEWGFQPIQRTMALEYTDIRVECFFILIRIFKQTNGENYDYHNFSCMSNIGSDDDKRNQTKKYNWQFTYPDPLDYTDDDEYMNRLRYKFGPECKMDKCENNTELDELLEGTHFERVPTSAAQELFRYANNVNVPHNNRKPRHKTLKYSRTDNESINISEKLYGDVSKLTIQCKNQPYNKIQINCTQGTQGVDETYDGISTYNHDISIAEANAEIICREKIPNKIYNINDAIIQEMTESEFVLQVASYPHIERRGACSSIASV